MGDRAGVEAGWLANDRTLEFHLAATIALARRPMRFLTGTIATLAEGEVGYAFQAHVREHADSQLAVIVDAPLIQPMPGRDVPICRRDGQLGLLVEGVRLPPAGWRVADRPTVPASAVGTPIQPDSDRREVA